MVINMHYLDYVDVRQGSKSSDRFSRGNTLPLTQLPFASHGYIPQTRSNCGNWRYHPDDTALEGVRLTHQPSPWIGDYASLILMPQAGTPRFDVDARWSGFRREDATLRPDCMKLRFLRSQCDFELVPTLRGATIALSFDGPEQPLFTIHSGKLEPGGAFFCELADSRTLTGFAADSSFPTAAEFRMYFVLRFDCDITLAGEENGALAVSLSGRQVAVQLGCSYISPEQAERNLDSETVKSLEALRWEAADIWEGYLRRIEIETDDEGVLRTFYSCMYRSFLYPHRMHEYDGEGKRIHRSPDTGKVSEGRYYTDNGFWDTCRTVYPLYSLIAPDKYREILEGYLNTYRDCGWLPKWPSPSETGTMPGTLIDAVIADAAAKGIITGELLETACEGMLKHTNEESPERRYGRHGTDDYNKYGYIPCDKHGESVNHTLDYVYGDFCLGQVLQLLGREEEAKAAFRRAENYRLLFDGETGFMRAKDSGGQFAEPFDPYAWGGAYCEGSAWQNSFAVYHDMEGLAALYGGPERLIAKIDELVAAPPIYRTGGYGREIHEMTEMAAVDFGQCAISNQPSFHIPYIYAQLGQPAKTEALVERLLRLFDSGPEGFPGDEDNGSTAGWYIFSLLGFYPFCPGKPEFLRVKPHVKRAVIHIPGKDFVVEQGQATGTVAFDEIVR
ncbi:MAG: GH92 family glycosyl hydrolase [Oscillospiraceae bacterium]